MPKPRVIRCGWPSDLSKVPDHAERDSCLSCIQRFTWWSSNVCLPPMNLHSHPVSLTRRQQLQSRLSLSRSGRVLLHIGAAVRSRQNLRWHWRGILRQFPLIRGRSAMR
jgi:hypothetical protein